MSDRVGSKTTKRVGKKRECCAGWETVSAERRATWPWQALHELGHSRVPFTLAYYRELARLDTNREADKVLRGALELGLVAKVGGESTGRAADQYLGRLPKKR